MTANTGKGADGKRPTGADAKGGKARKKTSAAKQRSDEVTVRTNDSNGTAPKDDSDDTVVDVPVAVKIAPYFSSPGEVALRLDRLGADGLVLFNRFMQAGIDPETLRVDAGFELSRPQDAALARTWIALLRGRVSASLAASSGVDSAADVAAYLLAGADVVMTTSALLRYGPEHVEKLLYGLTGWMQRKGFATLDDVRGLLAADVASQGSHTSGGWVREGYLSALQNATVKYGPES